MYSGYTAIKYLRKRISDVTHKYVIADIITKRQLQVKNHVSKRYKE